MTRRKVSEIFQLLRREVSDEVMSDRELLRAAVRLVGMHVTRTPKTKRRAAGAATRSERRWSTDFMLNRRGFRVFDEPGAVFHDPYDVADRHHASAYADYRSLAES
ncbi:MAG: hypothetical protein RL199_957 [Pseudomonadota bacterium]|jgi:hypothetical protein